MTIRPRLEIERVVSVQHGGFDGGHPADLLDFSSNVNPFGPAPQIWDAMRAVPVAQHPDPYATPLRNRLAETENIDQRNG